MKITPRKILFIALPLLLLAAMFMPTQADAGLVPCGYDMDNSGVVEQKEFCSFCHIFQLGHNIITFFLFPSGDLNGNVPVVPSVAGLLVAVGGIFILFGVGNPSMYEKGKQTLTSVVIGLLIVYAAWIFVNSLLTYLGVVVWTGTGGWWQIPCGI